MEPENLNSTSYTVVNCKIGSFLSFSSYFECITLLHLMVGANSGQPVPLKLLLLRKPSLKTTALGLIIPLLLVLAFQLLPCDPVRLPVSNKFKCLSCVCYLSQPLPFLFLCLKSVRKLFYISYGRLAAVSKTQLFLCLGTLQRYINVSDGSWI